MKFFFPFLSLTKLKSRQMHTTLWNIRITYAHVICMKFRIFCSISAFFSCFRSLSLSLSRYPIRCSLFVVPPVFAALYSFIWCSHTRHRISHSEYIIAINCFCVSIEMRCTKSTTEMHRIKYKENRLCRRMLRNKLNRKCLQIFHSVSLMECEITNLKPIKNDMRENLNDLEKFHMK